MKREVLSPSALKMSIRDLLGVREPIKTGRVHLQETLAWLCRAQDATGNGGVSAWYRYDKGWGHAFIETTGYIIPTFLEAARVTGNPRLTERAVKMGQFVCSMQLPSGGFRTYPPSQMEVSEPTIFNTGQDVLGLVALFTSTKDERFRIAALRAADFLLANQENDGSWILYEYGGKARTYETRSARALLECWKISGKEKYKQAAERTLDWAVRQQDEDGWFQKAELPGTFPEKAFTHTISYCIEGLWFSGKILKQRKYILAAETALDALQRHISPQTPLALPGAFSQGWKPDARFECLTGTAQIAAMLLLRARESGESVYQEKASVLLNQLKSLQVTNGRKFSVRGAVAGCYPLYGDILRREGYSRLAYPNWAAKFFADALLLDSEKKKEYELPHFLV